MNNSEPKPINGASANSDWDSLLGPAESIEEEYREKEDHYNNKKIYKVGSEALGVKRFTEEDRAQKIAEAKQARDEALKTRAEYIDTLEQNQNRTASDLSNDFSGETNRNDKSGRERTFSEWDVYPIAGEETSREYGDRLIKNHDLTVMSELLPKEEGESVEEYNQRIKLAHDKFSREDGETTEHYNERIKEAYQNNGIFAAIAEGMIEKESTIAKDLRDDLLNIDDMRDSGRFDEERAKELRREVTEKAIKRQREQNRASTKESKREELKEKIAARKAEEEEKAKREAEEREKARLEELKKLEEEERELEETNRKIKEAEEELEKLKRKKGEERDAKLGPALNLDFTHDRQEMVHDYAERELNVDASKTIISRIWKGTWFKKYYQKKYEREISSGERQVTTEDGRRMDIDSILEERSSSAITRFVMGVTDEYSDLIHKKAGESYTEADENTIKIVRDAIETYAQADPKDTNEEDLRREFANKINEIEGESRDGGPKVNKTLLNNYFELAKQARERVLHGIAIERVMDGFTVYNAEVRNNVRSEVHRDNIDKIVNRIESGAITQFIPPEVVAGALTTAAALTQIGARALAGVGVGIGVGAAAAGLRERNRVTEDRVRKMRDNAMGLGYDSIGLNPDAKGHKKRVHEKMAKYEAEIGGTLYDIRPAGELSRNIQNALDSDNQEDLMYAFIEAKVRTLFSDMYDKDLISYSSAGKIGDERLALDVAMVKANKKLAQMPEYRETLLNGVKRYMAEIKESVKTDDENLQRLRARKALTKAGKTALIGSAIFFASQEITALLDPNKIGIFEKFGLVKTKNGENATQTILARLRGPNTTTSSKVDTVNGISGDRKVEIDRLEQDGWTKTEVKAPWSETTKSVVEVKPEDAASKVKLHLEFADNGTTRIDGNELRLDMQNGSMISRLHGNSTMGNRVFNYDQLAADGKIRGYLTIGDSTFEVTTKINGAGQLTWAENGVFTTTSGESIKAISENGESLFKYFRVAVLDGVNSDGSVNAVSLATEVGNNTFNGTITEVAETIVEHPGIYDFAKTITEEVPIITSFDGIAAPISSRVGLGETYQRQYEEIQNTTPPSIETTSNGQNPNPEPQGNSTVSEPVPYTNIGNLTPEAQPNTDVVNTAPEPTGNQNTAPNANESNQRAEYESFLRDRYGDLVGEEGVKLMTETGLDDNTSTEIANWWQNLSDEAKTAVREYISEPIGNSRYGNALRTWLSIQPGENQ